MNRFVDRPAVTAAEAQIARVAADGTARHPHLAALIEASGPHAARDLADAVHLLCSVHGQHPGMIEQALALTPAGAANSWLARAAGAFERERLYLLRLTAAVGPLPSTPGAAQTEATLTAQRHAVEILARSERRGCALGAATALVSDWWPVRRLLDHAASRLGVEAPAPSLPDEQSILAAIDGECDTLASERALGFGCEQMLLQNRGLFDLLEARTEARNRLDG
ncbi:hypothetical protein H8M03_01010 [Sphingomonas sabuli]|uniref:Uncharacterized protein n=2 Tax=Sphingomonas sabuli TaxID=2764186 RepID=A0A7G9L5N6_9SPHN|nr:hypothetical protein H8M03_01010 [Sphingomonas sabuli]